ncbi:MAG: hypothetical protein K5853_07630 [Lachnospiraceae bacterium]|nr:hypothetical protein [Lachnospiraceae bacterium]
MRTKRVCGVIKLVCLICVLSLCIGAFYVPDITVYAASNTGKVGWPNDEGGYIPNNTHGWPVIRDYEGTGSGPGEAWVGWFNYRDWTETANHAGANDPNNNGWDWVRIVTASNGVKVKCFELTNENEYLPINDGSGKDLMPKSPWMMAIYEIETGNDKETMDYLNSSSGAKLKKTSQKRTSIEWRDEKVQEFRQTYEDYEKILMADPQFICNDKEFTLYDVNLYRIWSVCREKKAWSVKIWRNPDVRKWSAIKEVLHYVSPDGNKLYKVIYTDFYVGSDVIKDYDKWYSVGKAKIKQLKPSGKGYVEYLIK